MKGKIFCYRCGRKMRMHKSGLYECPHFWCRFIAHFEDHWEYWATGDGTVKESWYGDYGR